MKRFAVALAALALIVGSGYGLAEIQRPAVTSITPITTQNGR